MPCFTPGTLIATPTGEMPVETLVQGDPVITRDHGVQNIQWIGAKGLTGIQLQRAHHLTPIFIRKGALGAGLPERDMMVSPNQRFLVTNDKTALYFQETEVLAAAKHLTGLDGVDPLQAGWVRYIPIMFERHEIILANGSWAESFHHTAPTRRNLGNAQRIELYELFPDLYDEVPMHAITPVRRPLRSFETALLAR